MSKSFLNGNSFIIPKNNTKTPFGEYIFKENHLRILAEEIEISSKNGYKVGFRAGLKSALTAPIIGDKSSYARYIDDYKQTEIVIKKNKEYWADGIDPDEP